MMSQKSSILLLFLINCMLLGLACGLIGKNIQSLKADYHTFAVSLSHRESINDTDEFVNHHFCTGTLVNQKSVLTAAHCLEGKGKRQVVIIAGSTNLNKGKKYEIDSWTTYDEWNQKQKPQYPRNDIAVLIIKGEGVRNIDPVRLLLLQDVYLDNQEIRIMGWGDTESGRHPVGLRSAYLNVITNKQCSLEGTKVKGKNFSVPPNYFCSKMEPFVVSTSGDGGAPVLNRDRRLVGINIGTCPKVDVYPQNNRLLMNCHLRLSYYKDFLVHVMK